MIFLMSLTPSGRTGLKNNLCYSLRVSGHIVSTAFLSLR